MLRATSLLACFVVFAMAANLAHAADKPHTSPADRFDAMEKAAKHDPLTGQLTKDEFVAAAKEVMPKRADKAAELFDNITKADSSKVTKAEFVAFVKAHHSKKKDA